MIKRTIILFFLFGSLTLGFYLWDQAEADQRVDVSVKGVFHAKRVCDSTGCSTTPLVTFNTTQGTPVQFSPLKTDFSRQEFLTAFYDESAYHDGQTVTVLYNPNNPAQALISSPIHFWLDAIFWFTLGGCILLGIIVSSLYKSK